jgi:hypothetical protein
MNRISVGIIRTGILVLTVCLAAGCMRPEINIGTVPIFIEEFA